MHVWRGEGICVDSFNLLILHIDKSTLSLFIKFWFNNTFYNK